MEFFGDCVLDFLIGEELYESFDRRSGKLRERFPLLKDEALLTDMLHEITYDRDLAAAHNLQPGRCFQPFIAALCDDRGIGKTLNIVRYFSGTRSGTEVPPSVHTKSSIG